MASIPLVRPKVKELFYHFECYSEKLITFLSWKTRCETDYGSKNSLHISSWCSICIFCLTKVFVFNLGQWGVDPKSQIILNIALITLFIKNTKLNARLALRQRADLLNGQYFD